MDFGLADAVFGVSDAIADGGGEGLAGALADTASEIGEAVGQVTPDRVLEIANELIQTEAAVDASQQALSQVLSAQDAAFGAQLIVIQEQINQVVSNAQQYSIPPETLHAQLESLSTQLLQAQENYEAVVNSSVETTQVQMLYDSVRGGLKATWEMFFPGDMFEQALNVIKRVLGF